MHNYGMLASIYFYVFSGDLFRCTPQIDPLDGEEGSELDDMLVNDDIQAQEAREFSPPESANSSYGQLSNHPSPGNEQTHLLMANRASGLSKSASGAGEEKLHNVENSTSAVL